MTTDLGTWLRAQREERGWSRSEMGRRLIAAARETGDAALPDTETVRGYIYRWEHGKTRALSERYVLYYCRAFAIKPAQFGPRPQPETAPGPAVIQPAAVLPTGAGVPYWQTVAYRGTEEPESRQSTVRHEVLMAAHEGSEQAERHDFGNTTLEQLHADVARLSAGLMTGDPFAMFLEMRRVRDRAYRLLEGRLRPGDQASLYFLIGCLNELMAATASELGYPQAAEELIRAGWAYAAAIDNRPLMAHLRLQLASIVLWHGQPRRALDLAEDGLRYLAVGPTGASLYLKYAQAAARTGNADSARRALAAASDAFHGERANDEVAAVGGEFGLSAATEHYFAGSALVLIDDAGNEAASRLEQALSLYEAGPGPGEQHWFGAKAMTGIDLAAVRLRSGALDAAVAAIEPALSLPAARRINAVMARLQLVRTELAAPVFRGSAQARELDERIEEFGRDSVTAGLHALPAGPA